jgi:hypothetical protein
MMLRKLTDISRDIIAGLDASQMDEETLWTETQKYYPYADREGQLHLE